MSKHVPAFVKTECERLVSIAKTPAEPEQQAHHPDDLEESDEGEGKIPSDLSEHHHPHRTCEYTLLFEEEEENEQELEIEEVSKANDGNWIVAGVSIAKPCYDFKTATMKNAKQGDPVRLSDVRLLAMNDIYLLDRNNATSVAKYFPSDVRALVKPVFPLNANQPMPGLNCYAWCLTLEASPPADYISAMAMCGRRFLNTASQTSNMLDIHTAQVLTQVLPNLLNGPPDDYNEDSFVHYYLSPLISSVFGSEPCLNVVCKAYVHQHVPEDYMHIWLHTHKHVDTQRVLRQAIFTFALATRHVVCLHVDHRLCTGNTQLNVLQTLYCLDPLNAYTSRSSLHVCTLHQMFHTRTY